MNKTDLFREKIAKYSLRECFKDYDGPDEYEPALKFIQKKFLSVCEMKTKVFVHATCATDTENIRVVFAAVEESVLSDALSRIV